MKPTSLMSRPGLLKPTLLLKRTTEPPILAKAIDPPSPLSAVLVGGHRVERAERELAETPGQLRRAKDRRLPWDARVHAGAEVGTAARRAADAARVKEAAAAAVVAIQIEREHAAAFEKERPPLR